jgi:hypothetical protein
MSEDERLLDEARRSREETEKAREEREAEDDAPVETEPSPGQPWAKTSSGDADSVTTDDD